MRKQQLNNYIIKYFKKKKSNYGKLGPWTLTTPLTSDGKAEVTSFLPNLSFAYKV